MFDLDDDAFAECGRCADALPQYFEIADGEVRIRPIALDRSDASQTDSPISKAGNTLPQ
jgi:hypothetical protein